MTNESTIQGLDQSIYVVKQSHNSHIWLGIDSNLGGINWENDSIRPKVSSTKQRKPLLDISHDHALEQIVNKHTYITESSQSTLDFFFTNNNKVEVMPGNSVHEVVYVESSLRTDKL